MNLAAQIESILFWKAEPMSIKRISEILKITEEQVKEGLAQLENDLAKRGISLVRTDDSAMLGTAKEMSDVIVNLTKEELIRDLGKAGLETLSIILYQGPISRTEIDFIRGVNSQFILRNLLIRGLVERVENPNDARIFLYKSSMALLANLGVTKIEDLPDYSQIRAEIEEYKKSSQEEIENK